MTDIQFALLGHPANYEHVADLILRLRPSMGAKKVHAHEKSLAKAFEWSSSFAADEELSVPRADGSTLTGKLIICTFLPEHAHSPRQMSAAYKKTREGVRLAKELGARIVGLGGFTSIVGGAQGEKLPAEFGIAATSGNSLTAALAMAQLNLLFSRLEWTLDGQTAAVLGATGDIGRACALALTRESKLKRLILIARNKSKLESFAKEMQSIGSGIEVETSADAKAAIRARLIVAATSSATPLIAEAELQPGTVVCDIGYPNTLAYAPGPRPDVLAFHGGLALAPFQLPITNYTLLPAPELLHGCFAETIVLALADQYESFSIGQGRITLDRMDEILELAQALGFRPAPLLRNTQPISGEAVARFDRHMKNGGR